MRGQKQGESKTDYQGPWRKVSRSFLVIAKYGKAVYSEEKGLSWLMYASAGKAMTFLLAES